MFCLSDRRPRICCLSDRRPRICSVCLTEDHGYVLFVRQKTTDMFCWSDRRPRICSVCRSHNPVLSSFMTYHRILNKSNTTGSTSEPGSAYLSEAPEFTPVVSRVRVAQSLVFCSFLSIIACLLFLFFFLSLYFVCPSIYGF